jgi:uncharacterized protein
MSQAQKAPEPGMEDLLASIRRAINEDSAARAGHVDTSQGFTGPMRGLHPSDQRPGSLPDRPRPEFADLRNRRADSSDRLPGGFAGILSGQAVLSGGQAIRDNAGVAVRTSAAEPVDLREFHAEQDRETTMDSESMAGDDVPPVSAQPAATDEDDIASEQVRYYRLREPRPRHGLALPDPQRHDAARMGMLSPEAAAGAEAAFSHLADTLISRAAGERSIEDITRELLRPMLKQWLDENLPALVERLVREEIERVARRGGR